MAPERLDPYADPSSIAHQLDFSPGHATRAKVRRLFASSVSPVSRSHRFFLVASFGRTVFRLDDLNASLALSACLGVAFDEIEITSLADRVFRFCVSSRAVGFFIHNLRSFSCQQFVCYFHLWGFGGPNWIREEKLYYSELDSEWVSVNRVQNQTRARRGFIPVRHVFNSFRHDLRQDRTQHGRNVLSGANFVPLGNRADPDMQTDDRISRSNPRDTVSAPSRNLGNSFRGPRWVVVYRPPTAYFVSRPHSSPHSGPSSYAAPHAHEASLAVTESSVCSKCLAIGHLFASCTSEFRCRACYGYGHKERNCFNKRRKSLIYRQIDRNSTPISTGSQGDAPIPPNPLLEGSPVEDTVPMTLPQSPAREIVHDDDDEAAQLAQLGVAAVELPAVDADADAVELPEIAAAAGGTVHDDVDEAAQLAQLGVAAVDLPAVDVDAVELPAIAAAAEVEDQMMVDQEVGQDGEQPADVVIQEAAPAGHQVRKRKGKAAVPPNVAGVRRSTRLSIIKAGYKGVPPSDGDSSSEECETAKNLDAEFAAQIIDKDAPAPPHLSVAMIQAIGSTCQIAPMELSEDDLNYDSSYDSVEID